MMKRTVRQMIKDAGALLWKDIRNAGWVIIAVIAYFAFFKMFFHSTCPMVIITGYPCPACGLTRAGENLLRLDFAGAWKMHLFIYPIAVLVVCFCIRRYLLGRKGSGLLKWLALLILAGMVAYYIWRMAVYFPGEPPISYYRHNLLASLRLAIGKATW